MSTDGRGRSHLDEHRFDADLVRAVQAGVGQRRDELIALVTDLVALESPSTEPDLQTPVLELIAHRLGAIGYRVRRRRGDASGGMLLARPDDRATDQPIQLLVGHCDTVWPVGTLEEMPLHREDDTLYGPGIYDMKAGLAMAVIALECLAEIEHRPTVAPYVVINSDEEIGSHESTPTIRRLAKRADRAIVLEPSLTPSGRIKTARKGVGRFTLTMRGRAAHAGLNPEEGISAILELTHVVQELFALNDPDAGVTVNVGQIDGGLRPNVVAPTSRAIVDVRVPTHDDAARIERAIRDLRPTTPGVGLEVEGHFGRPPMEPTPRNRRLWELACRAAEHLGLDIEEGTAGGASDGNTTSQLTATIDGMGAVGDGAHAEHEHIRIEEVLERTRLLALMLTAAPICDPRTTGPSDHDR